MKFGKENMLGFRLEATPGHPTELDDVPAQELNFYRLLDRRYGNGLQVT